LTSTGHPFDHADSLQHFVKHLPFGSTFDIILESVLFSLNTARTPEQLPTFKSIVECVMNIELNRAYFQPSHMCHQNANSSSTTTPASKDNFTTTHTSTTTSSSQSCTPHSTNFCTGCRRTGHMVLDCPDNGGGQTGGVTDRNNKSTYITDVDLDMGNDGGAISSEYTPLSSPTVAVEETSIPFAEFGTAPFVPLTSTSPENNNVYFDLYRTGVISVALSSLADLSPICLLSISAHYNSILDSGCMNHIIRDQSLFWTYHTSLAVPVKTANCGILETLAKGDVKFRVKCGTKSIVLVLHDCLHAPSAPINLLLVRAMRECHMHIHFDEDTTIIHFPTDHPILSGLSVQATVVCQLSFLHCNFLSPTPPVTDGTELAFPVFQVPEKTPDLWHRRLGHLGIDATCAILTKDYATGVDWTGPLSISKHCVSCLIGKHPQIPYSNNRHHASEVCELLHMDSCGPFPVLTLHKKSSFWALLNNKSNYIHVELLVTKSDVFSAYRKVEASWEAKSSNCVVAIHMDGAKELCHGRLEAHLHSRGIAMQVTAPYAHSQNGKIEHFIRTLEDGFQTLLADSGLSMSFWGDTVLTMAYIWNRVPTSLLPMNMTPFEVMEHSKPDLSHLRVWGCQCFVAIPPELCDKGGPHRFEAIFVGYEENHLGWHVQDLNGKYHFS